MKHGITITIADIKNLLKEELCIIHVGCLGFRILMTSGENEEYSTRGAAPKRMVLGVFWSEVGQGF